MQLFSFSLFPCFLLCFSISIYLSSCSVVSPERLGAPSQNVLPLQVIPAFTASVKHSAFFSPMPMNTEGGNAERRSWLSSSLPFNSAQPSFSSLAVFLHLRALHPLFGARCPHFSMLWPPNSPAPTASGTSATESCNCNCQLLIIARFASVPQSLFPLT